jgi:glycosyltransferase involved in cell wall biosynthesis
MNNFISIVIPLYNKAKYIEDTIKSILNHPDHLLEIIIVDDGSTDNSANIVNSFIDPRIRLISQKNGGVSKARNTGIQESKGDLVAFLDADDKYQPGFLKAIGGLHINYPQAIAYATSYSYLMNDGATVNPTFSNTLPKIGFSGLVTNFHSWNRKASFFYTSSVCVNRRLIIEKELLFPEGEQSGEDIDVWLRLAENGEIAYLRQSLVLYRLATENNLSSYKNKDQILPCYERLINRVERGTTPKKMRWGAKRTYSMQMMQISQNFAFNGEIFHALSWLVKPYALYAQLYWFKTLMIISRSALFQYAQSLSKFTKW